MGRFKKYKSAAALDKAVKAYFASISRTVTAKEQYDTGEKDKDGHRIYAERDILNDAGEPIRYTEYVIPPSVGDLSEFLHIHRSTWNEYSDAKKHPEFSDTTTWARGRLRAWNERELVTRKDVKGIIFNLQNNYGMNASEEAEQAKNGDGGGGAAAALSLSEKLALIDEVLGIGGGAGVSGSASHGFMGGFGDGNGCCDGDGDAVGKGNGARQGDGTGDAGGFGCGSVGEESGEGGSGGSEVGTGGTE